MKLKDFFVAGVISMLVVLAVMAAIVLTSDCDLFLWSSEHFGKSPGKQ